MKNPAILDLYSDFLLSSFSLVTAHGRNGKTGKKQQKRVYPFQIRESRFPDHRSAFAER